MALGIETALPLWRPALAPGGVVAFSEPVLRRRPAGAGARAFWAGYPAVGTAEAIAARVAAAGYRSRATRLLTGAPWAEYYLPMERRIAAPAPRRRAADLARSAGRRPARDRPLAPAPDEIAYLLTIASPGMTVGACAEPGRTRRPRPVPRRDGGAARRPPRPLPALRLQPRGRPRAPGHRRADDRRDAPAMVARRAGRDRRGPSGPPPRGRHAARRGPAARRRPRPRRR